MTEENNTKLTTTVAEDIDEDEGVVTIEEEFKSLYVDLHKMKERWLKLAKIKEEENDAVSANLLKLICGDVLPLLADSLQASGEGFEELAIAISENSDESGSNLSDEEAAHLYVIIQACESAFQAMREKVSDVEAKDALEALISMTQGGLVNLRENFGDDISDLAAEQIKEAEAE